MVRKAWIGADVGFGRRSPDARLRAGTVDVQRALRSVELWRFSDLRGWSVRPVVGRHREWFPAKPADMRTPKASPPVRLPSRASPAAGGCHTASRRVGTLCR